MCSSHLLVLLTSLTVGQKSSKLSTTLCMSRQLTRCELTIRTSNRRRLLPRHCRLTSSPTIHQHTLECGCCCYIVRLALGPGRTKDFDLQTRHRRRPGDSRVDDEGAHENTTTPNLAERALIALAHRLKPHPGLKRQNNSTASSADHETSTGL